MVWFLPQLTRLWGKVSSIQFIPVREKEKKKKQVSFSSKWQPKWQSKPATTIWNFLLSMLLAGAQRRPKLEQNTHMEHHHYPSDPLKTEKSKTTNNKFQAFDQNIPTTLVSVWTQIRSRTLKLKLTVNNTQRKEKDYVLCAPHLEKALRWDKLMNYKCFTSSYFLQETSSKAQARIRSITTFENYLKGTSTTLFQALSTRDKAGKLNEWNNYCGNR